MAGTDHQPETQLLKLQKIIGFNGEVNGGLIVHPDRDHIIYPLGCNVIIEEVSGNFDQSILSGHTNTVTCLAVSNDDGRYLVSGQENYMGFKAKIILWDFATKTELTTWELHKVKVQSLAFSKNNKYIISLGGQDDGSVVVWDVHTREAICGAPAQVESAGITSCLATSKVNDAIFFTGGQNTLRVWTLNREDRKIIPENINLGGVKRIINCIEVADEASPYFFCGTTSGDILCINKDSKILQFHTSPKTRFECGVTALSLIKQSDKNYFNLLVGTGNGLVGNYEVKVSVQNGNTLNASFKHRGDAEPWKHEADCCCITSIAKRGTGHQFFVGTARSQIYKFTLANFKGELIKTCHSRVVNDIIFPFGASELVISCQEGEIRVWNIRTGRELRRFCLANKVCSALAISRDGSIIVSGWNDGKIRLLGFGEKSVLEIVAVVMDAHNKGVTSVAITSCGTRIISGGGDGQVRIWDIIRGASYTGKPEIRVDIGFSMKDHKNFVSDIAISSNDKECATSSGDGTTIIWDLGKGREGSLKKVVFANTLFKSVRYGQNELQLITCGTDRKIGYWETYDGTIIRELEGSKVGSVNSIDISSDWRVFVTGGEEKLIKVWLYEEGEVVYLGLGHSATITRVRIAPDNQSILSTGEDGAILQWALPPC